MDAQPLISVIVPIYDIERYIGLCIESIINQTYKNLEIILVDDGGKDRCPEICDLYGKKDKRIRVIHKKNGGLVSARKTGLQKSNGVYISYVDGDDWIGSGFIESLYTAVSSVNADVACAGYSRDMFTKSIHFVNAYPSGVYSGEQLDKLRENMISYGEFYCPGITTYVWNKLFRHELLLEPQINVDERISIGEDAAVTYPFIMNCERVYVSDCVAYHYRQREDSMLKKNEPFSVERQKLCYLYDHMMNFAGKCGEDFKEQIIDYILSICIMRSGGRLPDDTYSAFGRKYYGKRVAVYSAGTFGQQLVNRLKENRYCEVVAWIDDDYWEYRRCCLDVDPVESITKADFDYVLIASVDRKVAETAQKRLLDYGISKKNILMVDCPKELREKLLKKYLLKR